MEHHHAVVGLERAVELRTKELVDLLNEEQGFENHGSRAPQIQMKIKTLKDSIRSIVNEDEVDPTNEWVIKAHALIDQEH